MTVPRLEDVLRETGVPDLVEILAERLTARELDAVLQAVHRQRAVRATPVELLSHFESDPSVQPTRAALAALAKIDRVALSVAVPPFESLDLSPICPSGVAAALAPVDPGATWGLGGTSEVVSDCTTALALEAALRRRRAEPPDVTVRLCTTHRDLHVPFSAPFRDEPHNRVFALCTAGPDEGDRFESVSVREQLAIHLELLARLRRQGYRIGVVTASLAHQPGGTSDRLHAEVVAPLAGTFPDVRLRVTEGHPPGRRDYTPLGFTVVAEDHAEVERLIGLGGSTDWTRALLHRESERLVVSTIATESLTGFGIVESPQADSAR